MENETLSFGIKRFLGENTTISQFGPQAKHGHHAAAPFQTARGAAVGSGRDLTNRIPACI